MSEQPKSRLLAPLRWLSRATSLLVVCVGVLVLFGWALNIEVLKRILPGLVAMNPATAVAFLCAGASLWCLGRPDSAGARMLAQTLGLIVALIGLLRLCALLFGWAGGVDQILFRDKLVAVGLAFPNRMAPTTALNFFLIGLALVWADWELPKGKRPGQFLLLFVMAIASMAFVGYLYGVGALTGLAAFIPMALHTAVTFLLLCAGLLWARPAQGLMARVTSPGPGGLMIRRLLPAMVGLPLVLGWLIIAGRSNGYYDPAFGFTVFAVLCILIFAAMIWANARSLDRKEGERQQAEEALRWAHSELEQRVEERTSELAGVLTEIQQGVSILGACASELLASATAQVAGATQTASAVSQTTASVEQVRQTARVASDKARLVADSAQSAARVAQAGRRAAQETADGMGRIRGQMGQIADSMARLGEQGQAIGAIIATVDDLAQQSNLLAVNAAIEAAKAGERGRGFAVVAQEVRNLAEQSRQATGRVRAILGDIQQATGGAVMATEAGGKAVEAGVAQSASAGESIQALSEGVSAAAAAASQIAASSQQQLAGMDQMAQAMESVRQVSGQNADGARQIEAAARDLAQLGQRLQTLTDQHQTLPPSGGPG